MATQPSRAGATTDPATASGWNPGPAAAVAGALGGMIAGVVMAMVAMGYAAVTGLGAWLPVKLIAATWFGVDAILGGVVTILVGLVTHLVASGVFGVVFGLLFHRLRVASALFVGVLFGIAVWAVMTFGALPMINPTQLERAAVISGPWFGYHLVFGLALAVIPMIHRRLIRGQLATG